MKTSLRAAAALLAAATLATPAAAAELEFIPALGFGRLTIDDSDNDESGASIALSFGGRLARIFSLHGQIVGMTFDDDGVDGTSAAVQIAALFHAVDNGTVDLMIGPVFGGAILSLDGNLLGSDATIKVTGPSVGVQAGAYFNLTESLSLGPSVHFSRMFANELCIESGSTERCADIDDDEDDFDVNMLLIQIGLKVVF